MLELVMWEKIFAIWKSVELFRELVFVILWYHQGGKWEWNLFCPLCCNVVAAAILTVACGGQVLVAPDCFSVKHCKLSLPCDDINACVIKILAEKTVQAEKNCLAQQICRYSNSPPCVMSKWCDEQIPPLNLLGYHWGKMLPMIRVACSEIRYFYKIIENVSSSKEWNRSIVIFYFIRICIFTWKCWDFISYIFWHMSIERDAIEKNS